VWQWEPGDSTEWAAFEQRRGSLLGHIVSIEEIVDAIIAEHVTYPRLRPNEPNSGVEFAEVHLLRPMSIGQKTDPLHEVIRLRGRGPGYGDLAGRVDDIAGLRNVLAHTQPHQDSNQAGLFHVYLETPGRGQRRKRQRQPLGPGLPLTPPEGMSIKKMLGTTGGSLRSWTLSDLDRLITEARSIRDDLARLYSELFEPTRGLAQSQSGA
jgi:hypothetical protein